MLTLTEKILSPLRQLGYNETPRMAFLKLCVHVLACVCVFIPQTFPSGRTSPQGMLKKSCGGGGRGTPCPVLLRFSGGGTWMNSGALF